jgi:hypothetical protein
MMGPQFRVHPDDVRRTPEPHSVPWQWIAQYEPAAQRLTGQSLETLAARGGLSWKEMLAVARGISVREAQVTIFDRLTPAEAQAFVLELATEWAALNSGHAIRLDCGHGHKRSPGKPCTVCFPPTNPPPEVGAAPATWDLVKVDIEARDKMGQQKYGVRHQHDNGRDHLRDLYEELLDATVYMRAEIERRVDERKRAAALVRSWADTHRGPISDGAVSIDALMLSFEALARQIEEA